MPEPPLVAHGRCACGEVRFGLVATPLFVHGCHCSWCRRETGSAFAINAMIEADRLRLLAGAPRVTPTPSASGLGQKIVRCPRCQVALWSHYPDAGDAVCFVRVGTLDEAARLAPDIHIFTSTKLPWLPLPAGVPAVPEYYERERFWPAASLARRAALLAEDGMAGDAAALRDAARRDLEVAGTPQLLPGERARRLVRAGLRLGRAGDPTAGDRLLTQARALYGTTGDAENVASTQSALEDLRRAGR